MTELRSPLEVNKSPLSTCAGVFILAQARWKASKTRSLIAHLFARMAIFMQSQILKNEYIFCGLAFAYTALIFAVIG